MARPKTGEMRWHAASAVGGFFLSSDIMSAYHRAALGVKHLRSPSSRGLQACRTLLLRRSLVAYEYVDAPLRFTNPSGDINQSRDSKTNRKQASTQSPRQSRTNHHIENAHTHKTTGDTVQTWSKISSSNLKKWKSESIAGPDPTLVGPPAPASSHGATTTNLSKRNLSRCSSEICVRTNAKTGK